MRFIEIELDGTVVRARLNDAAPKTAQAMWDALPFGGRAVHAQLSGEMFRMLENAPLAPDLAIEAEVRHQYPGMIVYLPRIQEIAFCVGQARFGDGVTPLTLTHLGDVEWDWTQFMRKGDTLDRTGAKPIQFRRANDQATPFRYRTYEGRRLEIAFDGVTVGATLLEGWAPKTAAAFAKLLPLDGEATNDTWGGPITRFHGSAEGGSLPLSTAELESPKHLTWPGFGYVDPRGRVLKIAYGGADFRDVSGPTAVTPVFAIDSADVPKYAAKARTQLVEGVKRLSIRLS